MRQGIFSYAQLLMTLCIKTTNRLISGILTLIFAVLFAFVFAEERQRGLAVVIAIPLAISLIWYAYLRFLDSESRPKGTTEYSGIKKIVAIFSVLTIISAIASYTVKSKIGVVFAFLFLILIIIYEIVDYIEMSKLSEQVEIKEGKVNV